MSSPCNQSMMWDLVGEGTWASGRWGADRFSPGGSSRLEAQRDVRIFDYISPSEQRHANQTWLELFKFGGNRRGGAIQKRSWRNARLMEWGDQFRCIIEKGRAFKKSTRRADFLESRPIFSRGDARKRNRELEAGAGRRPGDRARRRRQRAGSPWGRAAAGGGPRLGAAAMIVRAASHQGRRHDGQDDSEQESVAKHVETSCCWTAVSSTSFTVYGRDVGFRRRSTIGTDCLQYSHMQG
jgi:hypothetical protein